MAHLGFVVPGRTKASIYAIAAQVRSAFKPIMGGSPRLPIDVMYELLPDLMPGFELHVMDDGELGRDHGRTYPDRKLIQLPKSVYDGMCRGQGRDRFTGAHELGHLFLHANIGFARTPVGPNAVKPWLDSEWQANTFGSALLIDDAHINQGMSASEISEKFGVSIAAAQVRLKK